METKTIKMQAGDYYIPVETWEVNGRIFFKFPYSPTLIAEIKALAGRKWHPDEKCWSAPLNERNKFTLSYLTKGEPNPFERYDRIIEPVDTERGLWPHQKEMLEFMLTRRYCIVAGEQGVGKSLSLIELMERSGAELDDIFYVSTRAGLRAMREELKKWGSNLCPKMLTFEGLKKEVSNWTEGRKPPKILIGDESSRLKNHDSDRSKKFQMLADAIREYWGEKGFVVETTGTPAPKSPVDWWMQAEIACPGFLREGHPSALKSRLALIEYTENDAGQSFPKVVTWWDNEAKCKTCGTIDKEQCGRLECTYAPSINEVLLLSERLEGLTLVKKKKDVLKHLPDKHYNEVFCTPSEEMLEAARLIKSFSVSPIQALTHLRTLSDGFRYSEEETGEHKTCPLCNGTGKREDAVLPEPEEWEELDDEDVYKEFDPYALELPGVVEESNCYRCNGTGKVAVIKKVYTSFDCPKYDALEEILEDQEEQGRIIIYAAFHASLDRIKEVCLKNRWAVFQVDGRGWKGITPSGDEIAESQLVALFQDKERLIDRIAWVAHPESSGTGLTLTEANTEVFFSNTFKGEDRMQAEDRAHREGMDLNKGLTVIDLMHLPTDKLIRDNVVFKKGLQNMTMGIIGEVLG